MLEGQGRYAGKAYFFRHSIYVRYDWLTQSYDSGYPAHVDLWELPETFLYPSGKIRDHIWYVTIDDYDYFQKNNLGHANNLRGLQDIADKVGVQADPIWMAKLREEFLGDITLLALFGAGSFPEWFLAASKPDWSRHLDDYCRQIRNTDVPILAVCGTHQLVGRAFADWGAVGHMAPADRPIPTVADEFAQKSDLIPRPRLGEVGIFPFRVSAGQEMDPLLAGLPNTPQFLEYHHDQVITGRHPGFQALVEPDPNRSPEFWLADDANHMNPHNDNDRCRVQLLRLNASDRVLYTTQFHPEMPAHIINNANAAWQSEQLIKNFIGIARSFWA